MIEKSQVLSTVQQVKLRKLELEIEALREQVQGQGNVGEMSTVNADSDLIIYKPVSKTVSHLR